MNQSESIKNLAAAFCKAQAEMENAIKNSVNPHFKNSYADLSEILGVIRPVLEKHSLAILQFPAEGPGVALVTRLLHSSGEWIEEKAVSPIERPSPQGVGSAITYLRRYALAAVCGITQEDDDGNGAEKPAPIQQPQQQRRDPPPPAKQPAPSQPAQTVNGEHTAEMTVVSCSVIKSGKGGKGPWELRKIVCADESGQQIDMTTIEDEFAARAEAAIDSGEPMAVVWKSEKSQCGRYTNRQLVSINTKL